LGAGLFLDLFGDLGGTPNTPSLPVVDDREASRWRAQRTRPFLSLGPLLEVRHRSDDAQLARQSAESSLPSFCFSVRLNASFKNRGFDHAVEPSGHLSH